MVCEPTMKIVALMDVQPDGAGYDGARRLQPLRQQRRMDVAGLCRSRPGWRGVGRRLAELHHPAQPHAEPARGGYDAKTGVGGAHENDLRDHSRGRIYRVVWDAKSRQPAQKLDA